MNQEEVPLLSNLECPIDNLITLNPFICSKCETVFCNECIEQWKKSSNECPTCRSKLLVNVQLEKHILNTQISKIKIRCPNSSYGCKDNVKVNNLKINNEYCRFNQIKCNKCSSTFQTGLQINHLASECEFFKLTCMFCLREFSLQTIIDHISLCFKEHERNLCKYCLKTHDSSDCEEKLEACDKCILPDSLGSFSRKTHICGKDPIGVANHLRNINLKLNKYQSDFVIEINKKFVKFEEDFSKKKREFDKIQNEVIKKLNGYQDEMSKEEKQINKKNHLIKKNHMNSLEQEINKLEKNINGIPSFKLEIDIKIYSLDKDNRKTLEKLDFDYNKQSVMIHNEIHITNFLLRKIHPNLISCNNEVKWLETKHVGMDNTNSISSFANSVCYLCNKHTGNISYNKCEKCLQSVCNQCKFICKTNESCHKNVFCKNCFVKCCLCGSSDCCSKCVKSCKSKNCSNLVCSNCHKPNKHLYYENCKTIYCKDCEKKNLCILTTFYCSNCNERFCNKCFSKCHQHKLCK